MLCPASNSRFVPTTEVEISPDYSVGEREARRIVGLAPGIGPLIPALHEQKNVCITAGWGKLSFSFADVLAVVTSG
jgi:hypothetical protein